jgi:hypothetical protein
VRSSEGAVFSSSLIARALESVEVEQRNFVNISIPFKSEKFP